LGLSRFVRSAEAIGDLFAPAPAAVISGAVAAPDERRQDNIQGKSLALGDFDGDGASDVAIGGNGTIVLRRGNPDAYAPTDDAIFVQMQNGYDPPALLQDSQTYQVPGAVDFLEAGDFTGDGQKDLVAASRGGAELFLLAGTGPATFSEPETISLPGAVTALTSGEFRAADGRGDVVVGINGSAGPSLMIFDGKEGLHGSSMSLRLRAPATSIQMNGLDDDPFTDIAAACGNEVDIIHGWGRKNSVRLQDQVERIGLGYGVTDLATGFFLWNRAGSYQIAVLTDTGSIVILDRGRPDTRPFAPEELAGLRESRSISGNRSVDIEAEPSWRGSRSSSWRPVREHAVSAAVAEAARVRTVLMRSRYSLKETEDLMLLNAADRKLNFIRQADGNAVQDNADDDLTTFDVAMQGNASAVLIMPHKLNGVRDLIAVTEDGNEPSVSILAPNTTINVDRTDDPNPAGASACTAAANDCSLRGALQFANNPSNNNTTMVLPANTYILSINGSSAGGCDGNAVGDLGANQTMTIMGAGAASTIIRQTGTGPANDGDRVMCMDEPFTLNLIYTFSGVTMVGGRDGTAAGTGTALGGGGIIGGEKGNVLTMSSMVLANNQVTVLGSANLGGGGIQWTGGDLNITNCTLGGTSAPGAYTDRTSTNTANLQAGSGGGVTFTPSAPAHTGGTGILTVAGTTMSRNTVGSVCCGGGGADLLIFAFAAPGGIGSGSATIGTTTISNNQATVGNGGAIVIESLPTTLATSSITNNSAGNLGGAIYLGGGSLTLNGTTPSITFTGNTAVHGGSGIGVNVGIDQNPGTNVRTINGTGGVQLQGTNTNISGHDVFLAFNGAWTNNAGSSLTIGNLVQDSGNNACGGCANFLMAAFKANNTTTNLTGNWTFNGGTFVGDTGTVNLAGNLVFNLDSFSHGAFTAGSSTVNFNGNTAQSISNNGAFSFFNLTDSNVTQPLTANNSFGATGTLNVNGANAIFSPVPAAVISGTGTLTGTGTARASRIAATPDFLSQYTITNKTLTNLQVDYNGVGNQTVNNTPAYSRLRISGTGTKTLQGATTATGTVNIAAGALDASASNFGLNVGGDWTNGVGTAGFVPRSGTLTFNGGGTQTLSGTTTFYDLTLGNSGTTNFSNTSTTVAHNLTANSGTMDGGTSTITFTGNPGAIGGANAKNFNNLVINSGAVISNTTGGNINIANDYSNSGTFTQGSAITTTFSTGADGNHSFSGGGPTTFGVFTINGSNTVDAASHNFNVVGSVFTVTGTFTGNTSTVSFTGAGAQGIAGDGAKNFSGLLINNPVSVNVINGTGAIDASVSGLLTLTTDLMVASGAVLQQSGTSAGAADVIGTVRRTDLGVTARSFGNLNNSISIESGTPPNPMDVTLVKMAPSPFPAGTAVVPRTYTLTPTGGSGISSTVKLRYIDPAELSGIVESRLLLWKRIGANWTAQGGTVNVANNFVSLAGVTGFSDWAIAEGSDLTISKSNNVSNSAVVGQQWTWTLTVNNAGGASARF
jgi:hypothetical protein